MVHGEEEAEKAKKVSRSLFAGGGDDSDMPTTEIDPADIPEGGIGILKVMTMCGLIASNGEGRRLIDQGGVSANKEKVDSIDRTFTAEELKEGVVIRKGKKKGWKA